MTINLADNTPRVSYAVAQGATQTSFTVSFEFFDAEDLNVYVDGTLKTLTTDYTVSGGSGSTGTVTISVTGATGGSTVVITRDIDLKRTTDFPASGAFQVGSLNTELDKLIAIAADLDDKASRALQLTDFDTAVSLVLPDVNTRKGKTLAFNASTGAVEAGPSTSDVQTVSATAADIAALADIEDGTTATDAISGLAAIKANVTTVAGISSNVTTVAGNTSNINAVAGDATDIGTVASNISSVNTNATNISAIQGAAANASTATTKASEAASSATAAAASAATATTQATTATTQATTATTKAGEAATSATASATSATASATSATASASSATAAAASQTAAASSAAAAATALDSFDDRYLGVKSSNPSVDNDGNALVSGALYFNDSANEMRVYDGANWIAATSAGNVSLILYEYTATAGQTTFSGSDDNSATLSYTVDNLQVVMNGIVLDPSDFTATNGTSVVLASGAAANDLVNIYAFKSFTTADMVSKTAGGTFAGAVGFSGGITGDVAFDTNTLKVDSSNNRVGISTASPTAPLHLNTSASGDIAILNTSANSGTGLFINSQTANQIDVVGYDGSAANAVNIRSGGASGAGLNVDTSNNVGIGETSPLGTVHIRTSDASLTSVNANADDLILENNGNCGMSICSSTTGEGNINFIDSGDTNIGRIQYTHSDNNMIFRANDVERMRISSGVSGGLVRIGQSGAFAGGANARLGVFVDNITPAIVTETGDTSGRSHISFRNGNGEVGGIDTGGSSTSYNTSSDHRLKQGVEDMTGAIDRVKALAPKRFQFIADADTTVDGFLAHEAQAVVPEAVTGTHNEVDDDGNAVMQGIDQSKLVPLLTAALKESIAKIETLETKVAALEAGE